MAARGPAKLSAVSGQVPAGEPQASCRMCLKASTCAILRNEIALAKQFPQLNQKDGDEPKPMFDPYATALTCTEYFPPDVRLFRGSEEDDDPERLEAEGS